MPSPPVPDELDAFLRRPNPAVIATVRSDGSPHTVATWYAWDGDHVLVNMDESRLRLRFLRHDPRVALTVLDEAGWHRHVSLLGEVASLEEDIELQDIDQLARRYTGHPFRTRDRRRFSAWVRVDSWHAWDGSAPWSPAP